jgi:hypothetical protein
MCKTELLKNRKVPAAITVLFTLLLVTLFYGTAYAYPVPELPADNLIVNPWFRDLSNMEDTGFDGWVRPLNQGVTWGPSQKESNPSPDIVITGTCGFEVVYCGTAARWAEQFGILYPYIDVFTYQVVAADPSHRKLKFFTYYVSHIAEVGAVNIYAGQSPDGPWELLWVPLYHTQDELIIPETGEIRDLWEETGFLEWTFEQGYPYYKVELQSRLPESPIPNGIRGVGFKITGVYFATEITDEPGLPPPPPNLSSPDSPAPPAPTAEPTASSVDPTAAAAVGSTPQSTTVAAIPTESTNIETAALTAAAISPTEITLVWDQSQNTGRGLRLERSLNMSNWQSIAAIEPGVVGYTDRGLPPDTVYYYRLRVTQDQVSPVVSAKTLSLPEPPPASPTLQATTAAPLPEQGVEVAAGSESRPTRAPETTEPPVAATPTAPNILLILGLAFITLIIGIALGVVLTRRRS